MSDWIRALAVSFAKRLVQEAEMQEQGMPLWFVEAEIAAGNNDYELGLKRWRQMSAQTLIRRGCGIWDELQAVPAYCERFRKPLVVNEQGEEMHTADRPFCADMRCECHSDPVLWRSYIYQPWLDGVQTLSAAAALFSGRQV